MDKAKNKCTWANRSELFAGLPAFVSKELIASARTKDFVSGEVMYFAGDTIKQVLLLTDGRVKQSHLLESGGEVILRLTVPGEVICHLGLVSGGKHSSTAEALQDCKVLAWESATFEAALACFPDLQGNAQRILEHRLAELERRFCDISTGTASPRLANGLVHLLDQIGHRVNDHIEIDISQEALGQMTGMTPSSVCRLLNMWKGQGHVKLRKKVIEIHSVSRLLGLRGAR
jgi:CRP-like cAMP-binding protein